MRIRLSIAIAFASLTMPQIALANSSVNERYSACTNSVAVNPDAAYKTARAWYGQSQSVASQHCMALALFELKNYSEAAAILEDILTKVSPGQSSLWLRMKAQAAKTQQAAGNEDAVQKHLDDALMWAASRDMDKDMLPLLSQRAKLYSNRSQHLKAVQDLDHAYAIEPSNAILLERARIFLRIDKKQPAREDIEFVLKSDPKNQEALSLLALTSD